eukprot:TRINITY_DN10196_c0_g1_i1.p1 TRINITY_DN10196_c0_g1~~TRINITY_DN10196_c0_g1_i1.p1  ORF type:complete len:332 (-),score=43.54 TRINITY_DN10196_c0_g1_i1:108-1103(-)
MENCESSESEAGPLAVSIPRKRTVVSKNGVTLPFHQQMIAGGAGAFLSSLFVTPFDVVKTRLQLLSSKQAKPAFTGTIGGWISIAKSDGLFALWRGLKPTIAIAVPGTIIYYSWYERATDYLQSCYPSLGGFTPLVAGSSARIVAASLVAPIELVRTNLQAQGSTVNGQLVHFTGVRDILHRMTAQFGYRGVFRGLGATLLRDVPFSALYWTLYEELRSRGRRRVQELDGGFAAEVTVTFLAGAAAGMLAAGLTNPVDVVKTTLQVESAVAASAGVKPLGLFATYRKIVTTEGHGSLLRGAGPRTVRVAPSCAIAISVYEVFKRFFAHSDR